MGLSHKCTRRKTNTAELKISQTVLRNYRIETMQNMIINKMHNQNITIENFLNVVKEQGDKIKNKNDSFKISFQFLELFNLKVFRTLSYELDLIN